MNTPDRTLAIRIDAVLPQTQCRQCGFQGCRPYAEAMASGEAPINRCPPGGEDGIRKLAALLGTGYLPFDPDGPQPKPKAVAVIDENTCIGCTLCIQACPVDAILGAARHMHTVLRDECTGCELCIAPCPVDCIRMETLSGLAARPGERETADRARARFEFRNYRLVRDKEEKAARLAARAAAAGSRAGGDTADSGKQAAIQAALARAAANRAGSHNTPSSPPAPTTSDADKKAIIEAALARAAARKATKTDDGTPPAPSGAA